MSRKRIIYRSFSSRKGMITAMVGMDSCNHHLIRRTCIKSTPANALMYSLFVLEERAEHHSPTQHSILAQTISSRSQPKIGPYSPRKRRQSSGSLGSARRRASVVSILIRVRISEFGIPEELQTICRDVGGDREPSSRFSDATSTSLVNFFFILVKFT